MSKHSHPIPLAAFSTHVLWLGQTGAGKSYGVRGAVEHLLDAGRRVCVLDYTGVWWGLRSSASGKSPAYPVVIFGGEHADVPLNDSAGAVVAKFVAEGNQPVIVDVGEMTPAEQQRFVTQFCQELYRLNRRPLHFIIEEADEFAPMTAASGAETMIGAVSRIFQRGRVRGFRAIAVTQRPANLHTRVRGQCKALVAMQLMLPQDRDAFEEWVKGNADVETGKRLSARLPQFNTGEGIVWVPKLKLLEEVKFPRIRTFDSMAAPDERETVEPAKRADIDLDAVRKQMAAFVAEAEARDPDKLQAQIKQLNVDKARLAAELEREKRAHEATNAAAPAIDPEAIAQAEKRGFERAKQELAAAADAELLDKFLGFTDETVKFAASLSGSINDACKEFAQSVAAKLPSALAPQIKFTPSSATGATGRRQVPPPRPAARAVVATPRAPAKMPPEGGFTRPQTRVLESLAMWRSLGHEEVSREMVAAVAGYSPSSGGFGNLLGSLKTVGAIDYPQPGRVVLLADGVGVPDREDGLLLLLAALSGPQKKIVGALVDRGPRSREEIGADTGYSPSSGGFGNLLGSLRTLGIIDYPQPGSVVVSDWAQELLGGYAERIAA